MAHGSNRNPRARTRTGFSLLELIVVLGILSVLSALLLTAVMAARRSAVHLSSVNNLRQITLATLQYNDVQDPTLLAPANYPEGRGWTSGVSLFELILPHLEVNTANIADPLENPPRVVKIYYSPADPSLDYKPFFGRVGQKCSYVVNIRVIANGLNVPFGIPDGTSSTVAFSESYHYSQKTEQHLLYNDIVQPV
ncbi:MAG: prepilin-type N-terminal cleavage/methylation domain-containing protein, partial [Gemmataceae bacterium]